MILWTIQYEPFMKKLDRRTRVRATWRESEPAWRPAYLWMASQMVNRGCCTRAVAPIWAWHSCGAVGRPPDRETIEDYCGANGHTVWLLEINVPDELVLLSHYGIWNQILEEVCHQRRGELKPEDRLGDWEQVFKVQLDNRKPWTQEGNHHDIQACLPFVDRHWIRSISWHKLPLTV